jgi:TolA-binding protein
MNRSIRYGLFWGLMAWCFQISLHAQLSGVEQQRLADGLYARGLYDLALVEYQKLIAIEPAPENLDLLFYRAGESAMRSGDPAKAQQYFAEAIRINDTGVAAQRSRYRLADEAFRARDFALAEKLLRELTAQDLDPAMDAPVRFTLGQVLESRNQLPEALKLYRALVADYPAESLSAYAALRMAAISNGGVDEKREAYEKALKNPPSRDFEIEALWGLAALEVSVKNHQAAADLYWRLWENFQDSTRVGGGMIHLAWAQLQAGAFEKALTLSAATTDARKQADADTWLYLDALCYVNTDKADAAQVQLEKLLTDFPKSRFRSTAAYELAVLYAAQGAHEKVLNYRADLEQVPGREVEGLWMLAESARASAENREALQLYTRIAHQYGADPRAPDALYFRALLLLQTENAATASQGLNRFATRFPKDPRAPQALEQAGDILVQSGQLEAGLVQWDKALVRYPDLPAGLWFKTALLEIRIGKNADARIRLQTLMTKNPDEAQKAGAHYWLGVLYDKQGEDEKAQAALNEALSGELKPEWRNPARMRLGQSYLRNQEPEKALNAFLPILGTEQEKEFSDNLLLWLLPIASEHADRSAAAKIANAMVHEDRKTVTRELGYYALAANMAGPDKVQARIDALQKGLAFKSESLEAAEAHLTLAGQYLSLKDFEAGFRQYSEATRLASLLEQGRMQAKGMMGSGDVRFAEEKWADAAKYFMSVAVLFDDPELSPEALRKAADAFRRAGDPVKAAAAEKEIQTRYPQLPGTTP